MDFQTRTIRLIGKPQRDAVASLAANVPDGVEVVFRKPVNARKDVQNALMWAGPLRDIATQAWVNGRQFSDEVWHEHFKRQFMPEEDHPDLYELVRDTCGYLKWDESPSGERICVASTTQLTVKGFSWYLEQVYAFGSELGVLFSERSFA